MKIINCPNCGCRNSVTAEKCSECDFDLKDFLADIPAKKHKRKRLIIGMASIVMLVAVCLILTIVFTKSDAVKRGNTNSSDASASTKNDNNFTLNTTPSDDNPSVTINHPVIGTYSGNDHEILAICDNGYAYYYCDDITFTELKCPWRIDNDIITIELARLHCDITAEIKNNDVSELVFKSDSPNWNAEVFSRLDLNPNDYIKRKVSSNDPNVLILEDGNMNCTIDGITFTIPKQYCDYEDDFDTMDNAFLFIEPDAYSDYSSSIFFYSEGTIHNENYVNKNIDKILSDFCERFFEDVNINPSEVTSIAEKSAYTADFTCYLNNGFAGLSGYNADGKIIYILDSNINRGLYILMFQTSDRVIDSTDIYNEILDNAKLSQ